MHSLYLELTTDAAERIMEKCKDEIWILCLTACSESLERCDLVFLMQIQALVCRMAHTQSYRSDAGEEEEEGERLLQKSHASEGPR